jgi:hypothetical protein
VKAGHENKRGPRQAIDKLGTHGYDLTGLRPDGQGFNGFTLNFAGMAADTLLLVLQ